jgi:L-iditol 2-dehydrogenase
MRAVQFHSAHDVRLSDVPSPVPAPGEVLVRVRAVSICPSDWRLYHYGHAGGVVPDHPLIQGHEFSGDVVALGDGVDSPAVGTRVAVEPSWYCGKCDMCLRGLTNVCRHQVFPSFPPHDGALAEFIACPAYATYPLPDEASYIEGALVEPLGVAVHALEMAAPPPGSRLLILGAGLIGYCAVRIAQLRGLTSIAAVEPVDGRREAVRKLGADPVAASARDLLDAGYEADVVIECAGEAQAVEDALEIVMPAGRVVVVGIPHPERLCFEANVPRRKELTVIFSRRSRENLAECVQLLSSGQVDLKSIPIRTFTLEQVAEAMDATAERPGDMLRALVLP